MDWIEYEKLIKKIMRSPQIIFKDGDFDVDFSNSFEVDGKVKGRNNIEHQIDVHLQNGDNHLIVECKMHKSRIEKNEVSAFIKVYENIKEGNPNWKVFPLFVSLSNYNSSAKKMLDCYEVPYVQIRHGIHPHFVASGKKKNIIAIEAYSKNKKIDLKKYNNFYPYDYGDTFSIEGITPFFNKYSVDGKIFEQDSCKDGEEYIIECSEPQQEIGTRLDISDKENYIITRIVIKYKHIAENDSNIDALEIIESPKQNGTIIFNDKKVHRIYADGSISKNIQKEFYSKK